MVTEKTESELSDWGCPEHERADFGKLVRGKYAKRIRQSTNVVVLDPEVAKFLPNDKAVNNALRGLIDRRVIKIRTGTKPKNKLTEKKPAA